MRRLFVLTMALTGVVVPVSAQILPDDVSSLPWVVDGGWVSAAAAIGDTLFVGGWFHSVARRSDRIGPFGVFDAVTGTLVAADPSLGGYAVTAATDDGAGGWYVAGTLSAETYGGLIHVDASGRRLPFLPGLGSAYTGIWTLARAGTVLFVGGSFSTFGGQPRANLAAVDMTTGALLPWNPGTDGDVEEIALRGTQLFVGGRFQTVGGLPRASLASVDAWSGAVSSWAPAVTGAFFGVRALLVTDDRVYVGGDFSAVNGVARSGLAAVDPASGALLPFGPVLTGGVPLVESVALRGAELFIAGAFETAGGQPRRGLAALDAVTGVVTGWAPAVAGIARVVEVSGTQVFASGSLTAAGAPRRVVRLDAVTGVLADAWDPAPGGDVDVVVADGRRVFLGGRFATHRAVSVAGLTAFSLTDGSHVPMPAVGGAVFALAASGTTLYLGGNFAMVGALPRQAVAAIDVMSRAVLPFAPTPDWPGASPFGARVDALAVEGGTVFFGGQFTHVSGQPRAHVAAVDSVTGALRAFALPQLTTASTPGVRGLAVANGRLWIGGHIAHSSPARQWLLVADAVTGAVDPLDYALDGAVGTVVGDGASVYVGGAFTSAGGAARPGVLKIAAATGAMQPWPAATGFTFGFDIGTASGVVVTPALTTGPPPLTASLEALDAASGSRLPWAPLDGLGYRRAWGVGGGVVAAGPNYGRPPDSPALFQQRSATGAPSAVADFGVHVQGTLTTLRWTPGLQGAAPTAYRLEAGSAPGRSDLARISLGSTPMLVVDVPPGRYFVRVVPRANGVDGPPSSELGFVTGVPGCVAAPAAVPALFVAFGTSPTLTWSAPAGVDVTSYELRVGVSAGDGSLLRLSLPPSTTTFPTAGAPPGVYRVTVTAASACGTSAPSNDVQVVVTPPQAPAPPTGLASNVSGAVVSLSWTAPAGNVTKYVLEAGSAPGLANLVPAFVMAPSPAIVVPDVASGRYYVRVRAANGALLSAPSNEILVDVP